MTCGVVLASVGMMIERGRSLIIMPLSKQGSVRALRGRSNSLLPRPSAIAEEIDGLKLDRNYVYSSRRYSHVQAYFLRLVTTHSKYINRTDFTNSVTVFFFVFTIILC